MNLAFISPRLAFQKGDFLGSGVPYWPLELVTLATYSREKGDKVTVIDQFGEDPTSLSDKGGYYLQGVAINAPNWWDALYHSSAFILYAISYMSHLELLSTIEWLKQKFPKTPIAVLENSQAVTAYSLSQMAASFFASGADYLICGEPYSTWDTFRQYLKSAKFNANASPNIISREFPGQPVKRAEKLGRYPIPDWDLIKLDSYWRLPYSHGPKTPKFLPILTSRGCPYPCDFCVVPETNNRRWIGNDPEQVVQEIIELRDKFNVYDFQIEDLNPTVHHKRWERICELLIERDANIRFYLVSGTKAETLHIDKIGLLASAGCRYISISPESGSYDLMKIIGKKFNQEHGIQLIRECRKFGIRTQACFLVGHPREVDRDFLASKAYLIDLVKAGLDEVAIFVVAPFAGSMLYSKSSILIEDKSALPSFSPKGRLDYFNLDIRRKQLIRTFFFEKLKKRGDLWMQGIRSVFGVPETKMENLPRRFIYVTWLLIRYRAQSFFLGRNV
ncbi:radical SAM protein [Polynucleobacter paneuropaeus]|jgi:radical SAM superfamily enzyme YgiQ (UPF0313 family)|nr:radical SAM protein [Polynucleobacter paneuropaeus]MBT8610781.1 radical SAM protein [Polynucleobacter paneuropaeus]